MRKNRPGRENEQDPEVEHFPLEPRYHPVNRIARIVYDLLASSKLAMVLLIVILACCVAGVTVIRGRQAWELIFNTTWFNGILVLLVINVACCFFGRIWGRRVTLISFGMILFHLSFVAMLGGIVYNSLFYFRGMIRLTEGESLPSGDPESYDVYEHGRYFSFSRLRGETKLIRMHRGYLIDEEDKRAAYEIMVGEGERKKQGIIYITHSLNYEGFTYFNDREGYSLLVVLYDRSGKELYGAHIPLQSLKQGENTYLYTTGTKIAPGTLPFPQAPEAPVMDLQVVYLPTPMVERSGEAMFQVWHQKRTAGRDDAPVAEGKAEIGTKLKVGDHYLEAREVRYWVGMTVRHEPGQPIVLTSLWVGLGGVILTFFGRIRKSRS